MPIHDRHEVQEATPHRNVRDVGAPHLIRLRDRLAPQQIRIRLVLRVWLAGSRLLVDRHQPHLAHEPTHTITPDEMSLISQDVAHLPGAEERQLHEQLVDALHQRQIVLGLADRLIVIR